MRAASVFYQGMFSCVEFVVPPQVIYKKDLSSDSSFHQQLKTFMNNNDMLCSEIRFNEQMYKNDDLIVVKVIDCDELKVGLIRSILIKNNKIYLVCMVYTCIRRYLQYFESMSSEDICSFIELKNIPDYKPLIKRGTVSKFIFMLHHRVSFMET